MQLCVSISFETILIEVWKLELQITSACKVTKTESGIGFDISFLIKTVANSFARLTSAGLGPVKHGLETE